VIYYLLIGVSHALHGIMLTPSERDLRSRSWNSIVQHLFVVTLAWPVITLALLGVIAPYLYDDVRDYLIRRNTCRPAARADGATDPDPVPREDEP